MRLSPFVVVKRWFSSKIPTFHSKTTKNTPVKSVVIRGLQDKVRDLFLLCKKICSLSPALSEICQREPCGGKIKIGFLFYKCLVEWRIMSIFAGSKECESRKTDTM